jgi:hypothetical protein
VHERIRNENEPKMNIASEGPLFLAAALLMGCGSSPADETTEGDGKVEAGGSSGVAGAGGSSASDGGEGSAEGGASGDGGTPVVEGCPPKGPFGTTVGNVLPNVTLPDCDGVMHSLYDQCEKTATWVFEFAGWCQPCRPYAEGADERYKKFLGDDFEAYIVLSQKSDGSPADAEFCKTVRDRYGMTMPVLYDTEAVFQTTLNVRETAVELVIGQGAVLVKAGGHAGIEDAIADQLGR